MKRKSATILALSSIVVIYGLYYFGLPHILNKPFVENFIENKTLQTSGYKIDLVNPKFKTSYIPAAAQQPDTQPGAGAWMRAFRERSEKNTAYRGR